VALQKKSKPKKTRTVTATTVICIPGLWKDKDEIKNTIVSSSNGEYMAVGEILLSVKRERHYKIEIRGRDERMKESFKYLGRTTRITDECLNKIESHNFVIYISGETGGLKEAENIAFAGTAVLKAGGIAIKIETTGKAFEKNKWLNLIDNFEEPDLYQMFVVDSITDKNGSVWTCGMHNLGLRDTIISGEEFQTSVDVLSIFGYYQIFDKPILLHDQTFQADPQSLKYRITDEPDQPNKDNELFRNPYGMWRLARI